jgi:hypothetical protein
MQLTPLEAVELYYYLAQQDRWDRQLREQLQQCIKKYRLNIELQTHRGQQMRKTYTCPFFQEGSKGCTISRAKKPYGCLGFNPTRIGCSGEGGCSSSLDLLEQREKEFKKQEDLANTYICERLTLSWKKLDIPRALLAIDEKIKLSDNQFFVDVARLLEQ